LGAVHHVLALRAETRHVQHGFEVAAGFEGAGLGFRVQSSEFRVLGFRVQGLGFRD
jgi:hypothetical protein